MTYPSIGLTLNDFQEANRFRNERFPGTSKDWTVLEWGGAMCGEAGEASNVAKKIRRGLPEDLTDDIQVKLADELADTICYAMLLASHQGIDIEQACRKKFNEVSVKRGLPDRV